MTNTTQFTLTDEERDVLVETLQTVLSNLRYEIGNTDSHDFKEGLKSKKHLLESLVERLEAR